MPKYTPGTICEVSNLRCFVNKQGQFGVYAEINDGYKWDNIICWKYTDTESAAARLLGANFLDHIDREDDIKAEVRHLASQAAHAPVRPSAKGVYKPVNKAAAGWIRNVSTEISELSAELEAIRTTK